MPDDIDKRKKCMAMFLMLLMIGSVLYFGLEKVLDYVSPPPPENVSNQSIRNIKIGNSIYSMIIKKERSFKSILDALNLSPSDLAVGMYASIEGIENTDLGSDLNYTYLQPFSSIYGAPLTIRYAVSSRTSMFELHNISKGIPDVAATGSYDYNGSLILELPPLKSGGWQWWGIEISSSPMIFGPLSQQIASPYIIGLDSLLDVFENKSNFTAYTVYKPLLDMADNAGKAKIAVVNYTGATNWTGPYYAGISPAGNNSYLLNSVMIILKEVNETELNNFKTNATKRGLTDYDINVTDVFLTLRVRGTLTEVIEEAKNWRLF